MTVASKELYIQCSENTEKEKNISMSVIFVKAFTEKIAEQHLEG